MEQPLVSIITITRNRAGLISRSIDSVLGQTYSNIEHIVVDGASTDNTSSICHKYEDKDKRFHYIQLSENLNIPDTINKGVESSHGDFITFLDDDDEYHPDKIEKQIKLFLSLDDSYGMVYCWMTYFDNDSKDFIRLHAPKLRGNVFAEAITRPILTGTPTYMIRRQAFIESGGWRSVGIVSDWEYALRICKKWKVDYVPESLINIYENHSAVRMSDTVYYKGAANKHIIFFEYLLIEYASFFKNNPKSCIFHLETLTRYCIYAHRYKEAFSYYKRLIRLNHSFMSISIPIQCIIKQLCSR